MKRKGIRGHQTALITLFVVALTIITILTIGLLQDPNAPDSALIDQPARDFELQWVQGSSVMPNSENLRLSDFRGRPVILNFWASWCVSCRYESKVLEKVWRDYRSDGVVVIGVAVETSLEGARRFAAQYRKSYPLALDAFQSDSESSAMIDYGVHAVPETFFIDRNGVIRSMYRGPVSLDTVRENLPAIMAASEPSDLSARPTVSSAAGVPLAN